jgi:hypothetical protein
MSSMKSPPILALFRSAVLPASSPTVAPIASPAGPPSRPMRLPSDVPTRVPNGPESFPCFTDRRTVCVFGDHCVGEDSDAAFVFQLQQGAPSVVGFYFGVEYDYQHSVHGLVLLI